MTTTVTATDRVADILARFQGVKQIGGGKHEAFCPVHENPPQGHKRSLSITTNGDGAVLLHCHACGKDATNDILKAVGLTLKDLFPPMPGRTKGRSEITATYDYKDAAGKLLYQVCRKSDKGFVQRRPDGKGGWTWNLNNTPRVLYRLPELLKADPTAWIIVAEGEKDVDNLRAVGLTATTNSGGAGKWDKLSDDSALHSRRVAVLPDNDDQGREHAAQVARALHGKAAEVRVLELPNLPEQGDVSDWLQNGGTREKLLALVGGSAAYAPPPMPCVTPGRFRLDDLGNAERFAALHGQDVRYLDEAAKWRVWDGAKWAKDVQRKIDGLAEETARAIFAEAQAAPDAETSKGIGTWALKSQNDNRLQSMTQRARHHVAATLDEFDTDRMLFNCKNGTLDLTTGVLRPHRREDMLTMICPVEYDPAATCPRWDTFLAEIMAGDNAMIGYLQRLAGYCLSGDVSLQILPIFHGSGANGKTVFTDTLTGIMGPYAYKAPAGMLTVKHRDEHPCEIAALMGKRFVVASETEQGRKLRVQLVKELTGDQTLTGRFMRQNYFTFRRTHATVLVTNNKPQVAEQTHAAWRRLQLIPFLVTIPDAQQDAHLTEKLQDEWPGILAWAVRGCLDWQAKGLRPPDKVKAATAEYRAEEDQVAAFLADCCTQAPGYRTAKNVLRAAYDQWCKAAGEEPMDNRTFTQRMRAHGFEDKVVKADGTAQRAWMDVLLQPQTEPST